MTVKIQTVVFRVITGYILLSGQWNFEVRG